MKTRWRCAPPFSCYQRKTAGGGGESVQTPPPPARGRLRALKPTTGLWQSSNRKSRAEEVSLCRLRIGHTYATHGYLVCGEERPSCSRCGRTLTVRHVIECWWATRRELVKFFGSGDVCLRDVLRDDSCRLSEVFSFLSHNNFRVGFSSVAWVSCLRFSPSLFFAYNLKNIFDSWRRFLKNNILFIVYPLSHFLKYFFPSPLGRGWYAPLYVS